MKEKRIWSLRQLGTIVLFCLSALNASANDGVFFVNGSQLVPLQETAIRVASEVLTINIGDDGYAGVTVDYEFYNAGAAKTVTMGFEAAAPYNDTATLSPQGIHPYISNFTVTMNGMPLPFRNAVVASSYDRDSDFKPLDLNRWKTTEGQNFEQSNNLYDAAADSIIQFAYAYYFSADFKPGRNTVRHTYRYRMSYGVGRTFEIPYWLMPAMRWANHKIDDFTLRITAEGTAKHFCMADSLFRAAPFAVKGNTGKCRTITHYDEQLIEATLRHDTLEWHTRNFRPTANLLIQSADIIYAFDEKAPLGSFYDRGPHYVIDWRSMNTAHHTAWQRRILRNLPYAHRGYVFRDARLRAYFNKLWWYMPDPKCQATTADLTPQEQKLIKENK